MDIRLRPLRDQEFPGFLAAQHAEYARGLVEDAGMSPEEAVKKARADHESLFPDGVPQQDQRIFVVEDEASGDSLGRVFWAPRGPSRAYLYDLFIHEGLRGRGLGRRVLQLVEEEVRADGLSGVDLNVWARNDAARALYRAAGYHDRAVSMSKELE